MALRLNCLFLKGNIVKGIPEVDILMTLYHRGKWGFIAHFVMIQPDFWVLCSDGPIENRSYMIDFQRFTPIFHSFLI